LYSIRKVEFATGSYSPRARQRIRSEQVRRILPGMWKQNKAIIILALIAGIGYGSHMLNRYSKIRQDSTKRAAKVVQPKEDDDDVAEIGYISSMRDEVFLRKENRVNLVWFVKVPATGAEYSCSYENGFADFRKGDAVRIIRPKDVSDEAGFGYIVGLHYKLTGKAALVWVIDEDNLELDLPDP
jgi:hypothetical protein